MNINHINYNLTEQKGNKIPFSLPYCWEGVTFRQMERIWNSTPEQLDDASYLFEIFTGIPKDTWDNSVLDLDLLFTAANNLKFLNDDSILKQYANQPINKFTWKGVEREIPKDIGLKTIGQYKDMVKFCLSEDPVRQSKQIPLMVAIYLQPIVYTTLNDRFAKNYLDYSYSKALELAEELKDVSIVDMTRLNSFFLRKLNVLNQDSQSCTRSIMKKLKLTLGLQN